MAQVKIRDSNGRAIPEQINIRLGKNAETVDQCAWDQFTDLASNTSFGIPLSAPYYADGEQFTLYVNARNVRPRYASLDVFGLTRTSFDDDIEIRLPLANGGSGGGSNGSDLTVRPRRGASLYGSYGNTHWDTQTFAHILSDAGLTATDVWCFSGWGDGSRLPFLRRPDGKWDLYKWNEEAFDAAEARTHYDNSYGIRTRWVFLDYYTGFSDRGIRPELPNPSTGPFRRQNNVNDIDYGGDHAFEIIGLPNDWVTAYVEKFVGRLKGLGADFQVGNEMAESEMHDRILRTVKRVWPEAHVSASRNSDAPSQYMNMVDTHHCDAINFHGWKNLARLNEVFPENTDRPKTYIDLLRTPGVDPKKIIVCSDGARNGNPDPYHAYDWDNLLGAFRVAADNGCNIDHQSAAKMALATYGTYDLKYVEVDFLKQLARL